MSIIKVRGIVIKEIILRENDKIISILSKEHGKISVGAKGARNCKNNFLVGTQIFTYGDFILYKGKKYYFIKEINIIKIFSNLMNDYSKMCYGNYFLETVEKTTIENLENDRILKLLIKSLNVLDKNILEDRLIWCIFNFKLLQYNGYEPQILYCSKCNKKIDYNLDKFSFCEEGFICNLCVQSISLRYIYLKYTTVYVINYVLRQDISNIFKFSISEDILEEFYKISELILSKLDLNLKTKKFINLNK